MMYSMMDSGPGAVGFLLFKSLHVGARVAFAVGVVLLLFWAFKRLSERQLWQWGLGLIVAGTLGCVIAIAARPSVVFSSPFDKGWGGRMMGPQMMMGAPMMGGMGWWEDDITEEDVAELMEEVKSGEALWNRFRAKEIGCDALTEEQFENIGEYAMDRMHGENHPAMNRMMEAMMGDEGDEAMHVRMGERFTGCAEGWSPGFDW